MKHGAKSVYAPVSSCGSTGPYIRSVKSRVIITRVEDQRDRWVPLCYDCDERTYRRSQSVSVCVIKISVLENGPVSCRGITSYVHDPNVAGTYTRLPLRLRWSSAPFVDDQWSFETDLYCELPSHTVVWYGTNDVDPAFIQKTGGEHASRGYGESLGNKTTIGRRY